MWLQVENIFGMVGGSRKVGCGGGFEMDYESYGCLGRTPP